MLRYAVPLFLAAFLLFQVQPMIARVILPWFGGAPSVWTTCMLFFQLLLVVGYAYSHYLTDRLRPRAQAAVHLSVLAVSLALLGWMAYTWGAPLVPSADWKPTGVSFPVLRILGILSVAVGLPYFVLATTSPLMQAWFSRSAPGVSPYRLYSLSNAGSLLALLTYPFIVEPALAQRQQTTVWSGGFLLFALGCVACAWRVWHFPAPESVPVPEALPAGEAPADSPPSLRTRAQWVILPALASLLLLAVTNHLCQDVAVTPFLWVVPLALYLLSFIICFDHERWYFRPVFVPLLILAVPAALSLMPYAREVSLLGQIALYSLTLFVCCMVCHGELVARKPQPRHLTAFYLAVSVGGAIGGLLVGIVAPLVFRSYVELPLGLLLCFVVGVLVPWPLESAIKPFVFAARVLLIATTVAIAIVPPLKQAREGGIRTVAVSRNFYGVLRVEERSADTPDAVRMLLHGRIIHGFQYLAADKRRMPTSYYGPKSGLALAVRNHPRRTAASHPQPLRIGVCGLGVGTVAAFGEPGDYLRFYEINPVVVRLAEDTRLFTYLSGTPAKWEIVLGDARLSLERELQHGSQQFDLLLLDAFSGDAVPAHLLTEQAFAMYLGHLRTGGALAIDVSNAVLDLTPVIWQTAKRFDLDCALVTSPKENGYYSASWMILTPGRSYLRDVAIPQASWTDTSGRKIRLWTDDYYNLFQILK